MTQPLNPTHFELDPAGYGIPDREELIAYRIWDGHYHGIFLPDSTDFSSHKAMMFYVERLGIERVIVQGTGGTRDDRMESPPAVDQALRRLLETEKDRISGMVRVDPSDPERSVRNMENWIRNGPCIGIKYSGGNPGALTCSHPNNDPIIELAEELDAVVYIHTWIKVGGNPRRVGGGNNPGESTPMDVAELAGRFPNVPLVCGHGDGDWELSARAVRPYENIFLEFSGSDPHSGSADYAVNELGAERLVWGGHGPSRSFSTELSKVLEASVSHDDKMKIFGRNYRRIAENIFRARGIHIDV
jgi:uncharacterized protein